ncbi:helix-turn-helix domain-containing protein [Aliarcobacter butzleri]
MEPTYIIKVNKIYKNNIKQIAKRNKNFTLKELSKKLECSSNYISNMCNKNSTIVSNNLLHKIAIALDCNLIDLNEGL